MNIFDPSISGSLSVSGSGQVSGDLTVLGTLYATVSGTTQNAVSTSHAASYTLTSSFEQFTGSYTTGSFTGSFIGNGSGLYDIPASGVTGLNLSQISEGSATASITQTDGLRVNTNVELTGSLKVSNIDLGVDKTVIINVTDSGGKYFIDNNRNPVLSFIKGFTYKLFYSSFGSHPFRFSTTNDGTHNGGVIYTTGVTTGSTPDYIQIEITSDTPSTLYYFCTSHTGMGNSISIYPDFLNIEADREVVYIEPSRIATTGSNTFVGTENISGSLSVTGSVDITGSISLNGQPIGTGKLDETVFNSYTSSNDLRVSAVETSTGSLNSFTSSIDTTIKNKLNTEGVVSGSLQISISGTSDYTTFSTSISQSISKSLADSKDYTDLQISLLDFATPLTALNQATSSLNSFSSSTLLRLNSIENESGSIRTDFNSYTSSNNSTNTTQNSRLDSLESTTSSINGNISSLYTSTTSLNTFTSSTDGRLNSIESTTGSLNSYTSSNDSTNTTQNNRLTSIETSTSSLNSYTSSNNTNISSIHTATSSLNSFTSSIDTTIKNKLNNEGVVSGSVQIDITNTTNYTTFSSSIATTDLNQNNRLNSLEGKTGSYATTGSNIFIGSQTITGSLYISQDLIVAGSSSIQHISSSIVNIADNIITVNALNPSVRFGGLAVIDSGSSPEVSGSMLFDSVNNQWLFVHQNQSTITSSVLLMGPETYNNLGGEAYLTQNRIPKGTGIEHLNDSNITDTGTKVSINSNTEITGTLVVTGNISSPNISAIETSTSSLNSYTSALKTAIELTGSNLTVKGDLLVKGTTTNVNTTTLNVDNNLITLNGTGATSAGIRVNDTTAPNLVSGSLLWDATNDYWVAGQLGSEQRLVRETEFNNAVTRIGNVETSTGSLNSFTSSINTTIKSKLNSDGVVSGSSQISFNGITDKPTLVSGSSQISFNSISDKPTLVSGSSQITYGSISGIPSGIVSGSSQITYGSISGIPSGIVSGSSQVSYTGLSNIPSGIVSGSSQLSSTFVAKAGDTMTGPLRFNESGYGRIAYADNYHGLIIRGIPNNAAGDITAGDYTTLVQHSGDFRFYRTNGTINELYFQVNATAAYHRGNQIWDVSDFTSTDVTNWGTAYTYSQVGHLPLAGGTLTGKLVIGSTGTAGSATLKINTSTASSFIHSQENFSPNMTAGQTNILVIGSSGSTKNSGYLGYNWSSAASNSNYVSLGHWGNDNLFRVYADGTVYMGTVTTGTWQGSSISTTYTAAKVTAVNAGTGISVDTTTGSVTVTNSGVTSLTGTANQVQVSASTGGVTLSLPQSIATTNSPTFSSLTLSGNLTLNAGYISGYVGAAGSGDSYAPFRFSQDYSGWMSIVAGTPGSANGWGLFWAGNSGAQYGTNGTGGPGDVWTNSTNPNEYVFVGNGSSVMSIHGNTGNVWMAGGLIVGNVVGTGRASYGVANANIILRSSASDSTGYCGIDFRSGNNYPSDGAQIYFESNSGGTSERAKLTLRVENDQEDFMELRAGRIDINSNTVSGGGQSTIINFQSGGSTVAYINSGGSIYARSGNLVKDFGNSTYATSFSSVSSVTVTHNLGSKDVMVMCYDSNDEMFWPSSIVTTSTSVVTITFAASRSGRVVVLR